MATSVTEARRHGREERARFTIANNHLLDALQAWLSDQFGIELVATNGKSFLQGGHAEIVPAEGCLYYDRKLEGHPAELLEVIAHEYGHLILHHNQFGVTTQDLIRGSAFLNAGSSALSRYNPRSQQEGEASAFASEFICPARDVFRQWRENNASSLSELVRTFAATDSLVLLQLAEGLYERLAGDSESTPFDSDEKPTPEQEEAAIASGSPILLDAGPGTGKTRTLVRRVVYLVQEKEVAPEKILVLTFSNEAACELQERIERSLGREVASRIRTATFHGFGVTLLQALGHHAGLDADFSILDEICQQELVSELLGSTDCEALFDIKDPDQTVTNIVDQINFLKDRLIGPAELAAAIVRWELGETDREAVARSQALLHIFEQYEHTKSANHAVDFADLIRMPYQLFESRSDLLDAIRRAFPWVLVDEYQDVSRATALLLRQICGPENPPWVVGDARQAIYRFRGAEPENVHRFAEDFPGARTFHLSENYRSSPEIVALINRLAEWLENPKSTIEPPPRWRPGRTVASFGATPASLGSANSDVAERDGIVSVIRRWIADGLAADKIAVLARRNIDVRNIALALKRRGIRAVTSGLLTAEGAGGDLTGVLSVVDTHQAVARVSYALYRNRVQSSVLNDVIRQLLTANLESAVEPDWSGDDSTKQIAADMWRLCQKLRTYLHSGDGWSILCDFLFFQGSYLRELLDQEDQAESSVQLEEILSALSLTANYRFSHPHVSPRRSRLGLAERMRDLVTHSAPGLVAPRPSPGAVRVMTCHASKGLEFQAVAVAGQSLADIRQPKPCLPPELRPDPQLDSLQAESLLFVGVSRAERAVLVSYANSASGRAHSRLRQFPGLLTRLQRSGVLPRTDWSLPVEEEEKFTMRRVWGGATPEDISMYSLDPDTCRIRTYLEEHLGARFRGRTRPLYPEFIRRVRKMLRRILQLALQEGRVVTQAEATQIFEEEWTPVEPGKRPHPHLALYRPRALQWACTLAGGFDPDEFPGAKLREEPFQWTDTGGTLRTLKLQFIAEFEDRRGEHYAIALQVKSPDDSHDDVQWSKLKEYEKLPFVLLQEHNGKVQPRLFFGDQGVIRRFRWSARNAAATNHERAAQARTRFHDLASGVFEGTMDDWICDRCACRTICPGWLGAIPPEEPTKR
jgi:superfamily I DNA/RNA helicase